MSEEFYKNWDASKSQNNNGAVPFYRPIELTEEEKAQARKNIGVTGSPDITNLENKVDVLEGDVASLSGTVGTVSAQFNTLSGNVDDALTSANAALAAVGTFSADLYTVSGKADTNSGNINALSAQVQTNTTNIASISGKNTNQDNQISTISGAVNGLTNNVNTVSAKVDSNASVISTLSAAEANDRTDINTLSGNLNTVSGIATSARQEALEAKNTANATSAFCQTNYQNLTSGWSAMQNDWSAFSAAEDAVITAATAAIPGQVSAEVSGQLSGKQDKLTPGVNITLTTAGVIDVRNNSCQATGNASVALGFATRANGNYALSNGYSTSATGMYAHAEGIYTISDTNGQHVEGQYNAPATGALHVIGNGTSTAQRSNIVETYTDRVVVNGKNTNDYIQAVNELSKYVYDNTTTPTGNYYGKFYFDTPSFTYSNSTALNVVKIGNVLYGRTYNSTGGGTYMTLANGALVDWEGDVRRCLFGSNLSGLPNYLPEKLVSMEYFAAYSTGFKEMPSGWHVSSMTGLSTYNTFNNAFRGCTKLTGDVTWFMDEVLAGNYPHAAMFIGCTSLSGYSTLTASPTYSSFF